MLIVLAAAPSWGPALLRAPLFKWWLPFFLVPALLFGFEYRARLSPVARRLYAALVAGAIVMFGGLVAARALGNVRTPPEWDVQCFWLYGRVAAAGLDFYRPAAFHAAHAALAAADPLVTTTPVFAREVLDVGFPYPPHTMLLMRPLGSLGLRAGALLWYLFNGAVLAATIVVLWRTFFRDAGRLGLAFTAALVLTLRATYTTVAFGQTSVLVLLLLLLLWNARDRLAGGVFAALGLAVKPVFAFFVAWIVVRRHWRQLGAFAAVTAALLAVTAAAFGLDVFRSYVTSNPAGRAPDWLFTEPVNQSLAATVVRLTHYDFARGSPLTHPAFVVPALLIGALTFLLAARLGRERDDLALALVVPAALLIYPQSLEHYTVLLLVPMLYVWTRSAALGVHRLAAVALVAAQFALIRYQDGTVAIVATAVQWLLLAGLAARQLAVPALAAPAGAPATPPRPA